MDKVLRHLPMLLAVGISLTGGLAAQSVHVAQDIKHDVSPPLREMAKMPVWRTKEVANIFEDRDEFANEHRTMPKDGHVVSDAIAQTSVSTSLSTTPGVNFDGVAASNYRVPDTEGAVGATQYLQWVNTRYSVYNKTTGQKILGSLPGSNFWQGFGGPCQTSTQGDIIALYDKLAARWVVTHRATPSSPGQPYIQCVAVSQTSDATGSYYRYAFVNPFNSYFTDYPKLGVWPDGYYFSTDLENPANHFKIVFTMVCAFDRNNMLQGNPATEQCFATPNSSIYSLLPSDLDGQTAPPSGSPDYFVNLDPKNNALDLWQFHVDWITPSNSTFTGPALVVVAPFVEGCRGGVCIPQLSTTELVDSLGDRVMYRFAYRNFGSYESLLVAHSVNSGTTVGIRWYELRDPQGNPPTLYQQGTYSPDSNFRWMPSIAQDKLGDIAVGYSVSSSSMYPAIRYTGRVAADPLGTMETELSIKEGTGAELPPNGRWGDYSAMTVDPIDDCTFWYTNEYYPTSSIGGWHTRIASFKFSSCH